jgi:Flp pilus assembly protein TadD
VEYDKALQIAPYSSDIRRNKFVILKRMGRKDGADRELNEGARLNRSILFKP